jgi:hypothetical protein
MTWQIYEQIPYEKLINDRVMETCLSNAYTWHTFLVINKIKRRWHKGLLSLLEILQTWKYRARLRVWRRSLNFQSVSNQSFSIITLSLIPNNRHHHNHQSLNASHRRRERKRKKFREHFRVFLIGLFRFKFNLMENFKPHFLKVKSLKRSIKMLLFVLS